MSTFRSSKEIITALYERSNQRATLVMGDMELVFRPIVGCEQLLAITDNHAPSGVVAADQLFVTTDHDVWCGSHLPLDDAFSHAPMAWRVFNALSPEGQRRMWEWADGYRADRYPTVAEFISAAGRGEFNI